MAVHSRLCQGNGNVEAVALVQAVSWNVGQCYFSMRLVLEQCSLIRNASMPGGHAGRDEWVVLEVEEAQDLQAVWLRAQADPPCQLQCLPEGPADPPPHSHVLLGPPWPEDPSGVMAVSWQWQWDARAAVNAVSTQCQISS